VSDAFALVLAVQRSRMQRKVYTRENKHSSSRMMVLAAFKKKS
jgi:hypothetical protein